MPVITLHFQAGFGIGFERRGFQQTDIDANQARIRRVDADIIDGADIHAAELHHASVRQAAHRFGEADVIMLVLALILVGEPNAKAKIARNPASTKSPTVK